MTAVRDEVSDLGSAMAPTREEKQAVTSVLSDLSRDVKALVQQEVALAKAEISGEAGKVGKGVGMFGGAVVGALMTLIFLSTALWWALASVMGQSLAALVVALVWAVLAGVLVVLGRGVLKSISLKPERTINSLKQLPDAVPGP